MATTRIPLVLLLAVCLSLPGSAEAGKKKHKKKAPAEVVATPAPAKEAPAPAPATPKAKATALYKEANRLLREGTALTEGGKTKCLDALARYREAFGLYQSFKIDLHIAYSLDVLGRGTEAAIYIEKFFMRLAAQAGKVKPEVVAAAKTRLDELKAKLGSVKVSGAHAGAAVLINGQEVGKVPMALPHYMKPGAHIMEVELDGYLTARERLVLKAGEHRTPAPTLVSIAEQERARRQQQELVDLHRGKTMWGYTALAGAAALAVGAAVLYGVGASRGMDAYEAYDNSESIVEQQGHADEVASAKELLIGGHVLIGFAAVAAGVSAWQLLTRPDIEEKKEEAPAQPGVTAAGISPMLGGAQISFGGRF